MKTLTTALALALALAIFPNPGAAQAGTGMAEGAKLYGQNCLRCHTARSPMERTDREWVTIVNHMRARANLRRSEAQALMAFLQATNAPEAAAARGVPAAAPEQSEESGASDSSAPAPPATGLDAEDPPALVLVDLADPEMSPETRVVLRRYLEGIRSP